jgi:hypothetical protein
MQKFLKVDLRITQSQQAVHKGTAQQTGRVRVILFMILSQNVNTYRKSAMEIECYHPQLPSKTSSAPINVSVS